MLSLVILIIGFVFLVFGADTFVVGSSSLARKMGVPTLIVGLTVVAFGTSAPELAVSTLASVAGENEIALGNILGSNIFNLLVVAGASAIIAPLVVDKDLLKRDWVCTIISTMVLLGLMLIDGKISLTDGVLLIGGFSVLMYIQVKSAIKNKVEENEQDTLDIKKIVFKIIFGLTLIISGGQMAVKGATEIAQKLGLSETLIGLTIVAIGTSLPELVTSIMATKRGENSIAIGNVIGSNLFNVLLILGVSSIINPIEVNLTGIYDTLVLLLVSVVMFILARKNKLTPKWGILLVLSYLAYTAWIIVR